MIKVIVILRLKANEKTLFLLKNKSGSRAVTFPKIHLEGTSLLHEEVSFYITNELGIAGAVSDFDTLLLGKTDNYIHIVCSVKISEYTPLNFTQIIERQTYLLVNKTSSN